MTTKNLFLLVTFALAGVGIVIVGTQILQQPYTYQGSLIDPPVPAADFTLQDPQGTPFTLSEQRGQVVLLFFGYTSCPDVCPTTLADFKQVRTRLGEAASEVDFVFITVDPERDIPERIGHYVGAFHPSFVGLTGSPAELSAVYEDFWVSVEKEETESAAGYLVSHTSRVFAVDQAGNLLLTYPFGMGADAMAEDIAHLLASGAES